MSSVPYIKFFPSDWAAGCATLSAMEELVYFKICRHNWDCGEPISERLLKRSMRELSGSINDALEVLFDEHKISKNESGFFNNRALELHVDAQDRRVKATKSARTRWKNKRKLKDANALSKQCERNANLVNSQCYPEPEPEPEPEYTPIVPTGDFDEWYNLYPHKVGKAAAKKAFEKAIKRASLADLVEGLHRYIKTKRSDVAWCNPSTWLNQDRWLDRPASMSSHPTVNDVYDAAIQHARENNL